MIGELAALGAATCWTGSSVVFEAAGRRIGSLPLNLIRLGFALVLLTALAWIMRGRALPTDFDAHAWAWLSVSGLVGFTLGDLCLFRAFVLVGARLTMLVSSTVPVMVALIAWLALGEVPSGRDALGMLLVVSGVVWAVAARTRARRGEPHPQALRGTLLALGGAAGQAGGLVLGKIGLHGGHPVAGTQIRAFAGLLGFVVVMSGARLWPRVRDAFADRAAISLASLGALLGPCVGVSCALYAISHAPAGVAAALMGLTPVFILPVARLRGEHIGAAGVAGALIAVAGVAVLVT